MNPDFLVVGAGVAGLRAAIELAQAGLVFGYLHRFAGHARLHRACRRAFDERNFPLERAVEAYERMLSGQARFRVVLTMSG